MLLYMAISRLHINKVKDTASTELELLQALMALYGYSEALTNEVKVKASIEVNKRKLKLSIIITIMR